MPRAPAQFRRARAPMPEHVAPMLAALSDLPGDPQHWSYEFKWDGVRALCYWDGRRLTLESRNQLDITHRYPELHPLGEALGAGEPSVLDGEIVALDDDGRPDFGLLQHRMHLADSRAVERLMRKAPVHYFLFDVLYAHGQSTMSLPFVKRREILEEITLVGAAWRVSPACVGGGQEMLDLAKERRLEGLVAKRLDSIYEPGRRSGAWRKIKIVGRQEFVIGGWIPEKNNPLSKRIGSLLLGYYERAGDEIRLRYAGRVGSGFDAEYHRLLYDLLRQRKRQADPFLDETGKSGAWWVVPDLVAEVEYRRWPRDGVIQQAAFKGLRFDKDPKSVRKEIRPEV